MPTIRERGAALAHWTDIYRRTRSKAQAYLASSNEGEILPWRAGAMQVVRYFNPQIMLAQLFLCCLSKAFAQIVSVHDWYDLDFRIEI
jgi:hypothetical protein